MSEPTFALRALYSDPMLGERIELFGWVGLDRDALAERWVAFREMAGGEVCGEVWQGGQFIDTVTVSRRTIELMRDEPFADVVNGAREALARRAERKGEYLRANQIRAAIRAAQST